METNPYAATRREAKASKLARLLRDAGAGVVGARALDAQGRRICERAAGVNPSSDETWDLAIAKLAQLLARAAAERN